MGRTACTEPQCLYKGALYLSPLLVPWSRKSGAIPLLSLWAVRPVQSLSACTRVHFTPHTFYGRGQERLELYLYSPYGPYGLYRASVPVQGCTLPLTPSSAVVKKEWSYTSTLLMGRTACTEPQCLYKGALYPSHLLRPWSRKGGAIPLLFLWAVRPVQSLSACTRVHFTPHPF